MLDKLLLEGPSLLLDAALGIGREQLAHPRWSVFSRRAELQGSHCLRQRPWRGLGTVWHRVLGVPLGVLKLPRLGSRHEGLQTCGIRHNVASAKLATILESTDDMLVVDGFFVRSETETFGARRSFAHSKGGGVLYLFDLEEPVPVSALIQ